MEDVECDEAKGNPLAGGGSAHTYPLLMKN